MIFGQWQADLMADKGQTTDGVRVDKKLTINPLFRDFIPKGRSASGTSLHGNRNDFNLTVTPVSSKPISKIDSRFDIGRAIGNVVKWDKELGSKVTCRIQSYI